MWCVAISTCSILIITGLFLFQLETYTRCGCDTRWISISSWALWANSVYNRDWFHPSCADACTLYPTDSIFRTINNLVIDIIARLYRDQYI